VARVLLDNPNMVVEILPRVAGVKIESPWGKGQQGRVRCTARLTRALTPRESERLRVLADVQVEGDLLRYSCRPEEVEDWEERIAHSLRQITRPGANEVRRKRRSQ
jgi:hypothetical protein